MLPQKRRLCRRRAKHIPCILISPADLRPVKEGAASNQQYGFLRNVGFKPGLSGNVEMEIYTQNGVFEIFPLCDKVSYDGKTVSDDALVSNGVFSTADNGKITSVIPAAYILSLQTQTGK